MVVTTAMITIIVNRVGFHRQWKKQGMASTQWCAWLAKEWPETFFALHYICS